MCSKNGSSSRAPSLSRTLQCTATLHSTTGTLSAFLSDSLSKDSQRHSIYKWLFCTANALNNVLSLAGHVIAFGGDSNACYVNSHPKKLQEKEKMKQNERQCACEHKAGLRLRRVSLTSFFIFLFLFLCFIVYLILLLLLQSDAENNFASG